MKPCRVVCSAIRCRKSVQETPDGILRSSRSVIVSSDTIFAIVGVNVVRLSGVETVTISLVSIRSAKTIERVIVELAIVLSIDVGIESLWNYDRLDHVPVRATDRQNPSKEASNPRRVCCREAFRQVNVPRQAFALEAEPLVMVWLEIAVPSGRALNSAAESWPC